jgi:hypothetical protein
MIYYANVMELSLNSIFDLFNKFDAFYNLKISPISDYPEYKVQYVSLLKELYVNDIILYAINSDVINIFTNIKIRQHLHPELYEYIINSLTEIIDIIEIYKLNINILSESLNFVRLFYDDHTVYGLFDVLDDNIIKTNYIYNTQYYVNVNNLPTMNIFSFFPPNPTVITLPPNLSTYVQNLIIELVKMLSDTYKVNYTALPSLFGYNIYLKPDFITFIENIDLLIENAKMLFDITDPTFAMSNMVVYIYSWDIIQKFISNCLQVKLFIKSMFYLNKVEIHINCSPLLNCFTDINNNIYSIKYIYSTIQKIITDPQFVIRQYQTISNLLLNEITNTTIYPTTFNYIFNPYNRYAIMIVFLKGLYDLKINLLDKLNIGIFDSVFKYLNLGYQGEDIIPFNDYNLLIDQRSILYTSSTNTSFNQQNLYIPTGNMHLFDSNLFILQLINIFNTNKQTVNNYYLALDNSDNKYALVFSALNYGYIHTNYLYTP